MSPSHCGWSTQWARGRQYTGARIPEQALLPGGPSARLLLCFVTSHFQPLPIHPSLRPDLCEPVLSRRNSPQIFLNVLFSDVPHRDFLPVTVGPTKDGKLAIKLQIGENKDGPNKEQLPGGPAISGAFDLNSGFSINCTLLSPRADKCPAWLTRRHSHDAAS